MINPSMILRFLLVGGSTALLYFGLTYVLVESLALEAVLASSAAYLVAVCYNYLLHYYWTFASDAAHNRVVVKYVLTCLGGVALNGLVMHYGVRLLPLHYLVVQLIAAGTLVCWSFSVSTLWVFSRKK
jgi:putative flippase GtrA